MRAAIFAALAMLCVPGFAEAQYYQEPYGQYPQQQPYGQYPQQQPYGQYPQQPGYPPPVYVVPVGQRHVGLYLRGTAGLAYSGVQFRDFGGDLSITGPGASLSFAIGGAIAENVILNVDFWGFSMFSPTLRSDGEEIGTADDTTFSTGAVGGGLTYWLMPANVYVAVSAGFAAAVVEGPTGTAESEIGLGLNLMLGKEWWIGPRWGIGLAGQMVFMTLPDNGERLDVWSGALLLSLSYSG